MKDERNRAIAVLSYNQNKADAAVFIQLAAACFKEATKKSMNTQSVKENDLTVSAQEAETGDMGQKLLISGDKVALRMWDEQPGDGEDKAAHARSYETAGYVIEGKAELTLDGKTIPLEPGVSWVVPQGAEHSYKILEPFRAVEATHPPARGYKTGQ